MWKLNRSRKRVPALDRWADQQWQDWETRRCVWVVCDREVCPFCSAVSEAASADHMAAAHHAAGARRRWRGHAQAHRAEMAALGGCRCGRQLGVGEARSLAYARLARYGSFTGGHGG